MNCCEIRECRCRLLGFDYWAVTLDTGRTIAVCRRCYRKVRAARKAVASC